MITAATSQRRSDSRRHPLVVPDGAAAGSRAHLRWSPLVIRLALAADATAIRRLAQMDSARPLGGQALVAEQGGSVIAAVSLSEGTAVADPFLASADAVAMLRLRATQLRDAHAA